MTDAQIISTLLGAIGVVGGAVGFLFREYAARMKESADEWRTHAKGLERAQDDQARAQETLAAAFAAQQKSRELEVEMLTQIFYAMFPPQAARRSLPGARETP